MVIDTRMLEGETQAAIARVAKMLAQSGEQERVDLVRDLLSRLPATAVNPVSRAIESVSAELVHKGCSDLRTDAVTAWAEGDMTRARLALAAAVRDSIFDWELHYDLARVLEALGEPDAARVHYAFAAHLGCDDGSAERALDRIGNVSWRHHPH